MILPESILTTDWFAALAGFVAINTAIYVALAVVKALPRIYVSDYVQRSYERSETRSIHPDSEERGRPGARD
ncbi:hypothetical protein [Brevibacterium senegalense]|uniref:hypothetical protein n=1 Tax=Brevibacterium senegalense TaxID=1033736 RepID=UPI00031A85C4|nr:hypothetical protein [Brevibacterium senegalense]